MQCRGSGTTLRLFTALCALTSGKCVLTCDDTLVRRPIKGLLLALRQLDVETRSLGQNGGPPLEVYGGTLTGGLVSIAGDISSQYISALLLVCSKANEDSTLTIRSDIESKSYIDMTIDVMNQFGVLAEAKSNWRYFEVPGEQEYHSTEFYTEGDYSSASFLMAAGALSGHVVVRGLESESLQGDAAIISILRRMGASIRTSEKGICVEASDLRACAIDASQIPDLVPVLTLIATKAKGTTRICNAGRLRLKESNRLTSSASELVKMGADIIVTEDGLNIRGPTRLVGNTLYAHKDHRIAMTCILAGTIADGETVVEGIESIKKSYPEFIRDIRTLGAEIELPYSKKEPGGIA
jgi:3-phosphoshikimate 1-carboxyvinyltransferase